MEKKSLSIEELILEDQESDLPPAPPEGGIAQQRIPGWLRWPIKIIILPFLHLDLCMQKLAGWIIPPPYKKVGKCKKRGKCCHYILLEYRKGIMGKLLLYWNTELNGFYLRQNERIESDGRPMWVMGCRYLKKDGRCAHYRTRPMVCRSWPVIESFRKPRILKGCGFKIEVRNQKSLLLLDPRSGTKTEKGGKEQ